ncbi:MAG: hypothetical protein V2I46_01080 [Bacteroides sp.]|jgi:hypothetical protein|nr:hypothetical protein [Bacteroides sp.]
MIKRALIFTILLLIGMKSHSLPFGPFPFIDNNPPVTGCTVISVAKGDRVFFGGNDDYINPDSWYWVDPGDSTRYGVIWIGTPDNPQQGVNEKGLAYDSNGLPRVEVNPHRERIPVSEAYHLYCMQIMQECARVEEVIAWVNLHQRPPYMHDQLHFADATGDAVIISAGADGEMVFRRKPPGDGFLVSTNFNVANPDNGFGFPCWRYDRAEALIGELISKPGPMDFQEVTQVMDAVHVEKGSSWTLETLVADLVKGVVYIYYFYQYDRPLVLEVASELANPRESGPLSQLFPEDVREEAARRYQEARAGFRMSRIIGILWPALVLFSLLMLIILLKDTRKGSSFWFAAVLVLGPLGLIARSLAKIKRETPVVRNSIIETTGNLIPIVIFFTLGLTLLILETISGTASPLFQLFLILILPLILVWLSQGILMVHLSQKGFPRFLFQRLLQAVISAFLSLAGIVPVAMILSNRNLNISLIIPLSPLAVANWWAYVVLGSVPGGILVYLFERWETKRGYRAWTSLINEEGTLSLPPFRKTWGWLLISLVMLLGGLVLGTSLSHG